MSEKIQVWLGTNDVEQMYVNLTGSRKGITRFKRIAETLSSRSKGGAIIYKDEEALFKIFQREMPDILEKKRIKHFYELVQRIS